jgi:hypothetical protein
VPSNDQKTSLWTALKSVASDFANDRFSGMRKSGPGEVQYKPTDMIPAMPGKTADAAETIRRYNKWQDWASQRFGSAQDVPQDASFDNWHKIIYGSAPEPLPQAAQGLQR